MKQKIVINVPMQSAKAKSKAMKIAVGIHGVTSANVGAEEGRLEVVGEGVDSVLLVNCLRKKFCFANIISLEEVKPPPPPPTDDKKSATSEEVCKCIDKIMQYCPPPPPYCPCPPPYYECRVYDAGAPPNCSIS